MSRKKGVTRENIARQQKDIRLSLMSADNLMKYANELAILAYGKMLAKIEQGDLYGAREEFKRIDNEENRFAAKIAMEKIAVHFYGHKRYEEDADRIPEIRDYLSGLKLEEFKREILDIVIDWMHRENGRVSPSLKPRVRIDHPIDENVQELGND